MKAWIAFVAAVICGIVIWLMPDGDSSQNAQPAGQTPPASTPVPAPDVDLTSEEMQRWAKLPADRSAIPAVLYHGIGPESDFANADDASYGVDVDEFARQMTLMKHAGYETIDLQTFIDFVQRKPVDLPPRPLLLTFDDGRLDSWTGADDILEEARLHGGDVRRRRHRGRRRGPRVPDMDTTRERCRTAAVGTFSCTPATATEFIQASTARRRLTTRSRTTGSRLPTGRSGCGPTSNGASRRSPTTSRATSRSPSRPLTATTVRQIRALATTCSAGSATATTRCSLRT